MGNSGISPKDASESCFVADEGAGFDVPHLIRASGDVVAVFLETNRVVGTVDADGFLTLGGLLHVDQGTLGETLVLTIRAQLRAVDAGGTLGVDGLDVEVILHRGTSHEKSLGNLEGSFGSGWQTFTLDVDVLDVRFPADPCRGQDASAPCAQVPVPRPNEVSFRFTGNIPLGLTFELDWLTLEPKDQPGLAWRPVLLAHGWRGGPDDLAGLDPLQGRAAWGIGLASRDVGFAAVALDHFGTIRDNTATFSAAVADLKQRFGVERVNVVGYCKGGIDAREHVRRNDDVDRLIMVATPNAGSFLVDSMLVSPNILIWEGEDPKKVASSLREMSGPRMSSYNRHCRENPRTVYVSEAIVHSSPFANAWLPLVGLNDEFVSLFSVRSLPYAAADAAFTSTTDPEAQACANLPFAVGGHLCLLTYDSIVNDLFRRPGGTHPTAGTVRRLGDPANLAREGAAAARAGPAQDDLTAVLQGLGFDTALLPPDGVTQAHAVLVDAVDAALFLVFVDRAGLRLELVSPTGRRIDATTPLTDPAVVHAPPANAGPVSVTGYSLQAPETGSWTLEVTGTGVPSPDTAYAVTALAQLPPGTGVVLATTIDRDQYVVGEPITITATVTADGVPVTDATVTAKVTDPDGTVTADLVLVDDGTGGDAVAGDGVYTGAAAAAPSGFASIVVSAERAAPAFSRQQQLEVLVTPNPTRFSGTVSDHGVDVDGDGRFDQLVVEVELDVAVAAAYRLFGTLTDGAGTAIEQLRVEQQLQVGLQTVSLAFDGGRLFALGHDGPYRLDDLVLEDAATLTGLDVAAAYTTAAYAHTDFQRPPLLLTGNASDHGAHTLHMERLPYEELVIEVEVDTSIAVEVEATANLHADDGSFLVPGRAFSSLAPGLAMLEFHFRARSIFRAGMPGPYTLRLLSIWGTAADGTAVSLQAPGVVAVTQPYRLEDFAESPRFTVGGTVTGLVGRGLVLELAAEGPPGTPAATPLRVVGNGPFTFTFPGLVSGNPYEVRVKTPPANPVQVCTVNNASGTIEDANVTNVEVLCV